MRKFLSTIFVIIFTTPVLAATVPKEDCDKATSENNCPAGCKWALSCKICTDNSYSTTNASADCTKCPDAYPYATDGATSAGECYVECAIKNLKDNTGTIAPDNNRAYNPPTTPPRSTTCNYTTPTNITCNEGYHLTTAVIGNSDLSNIGNLCVSNTLACKDTGELSGCPDNAIVGDAVWDNGKWNYADCKCETTADPANVHGTVIVQCDYDSGTGRDTKWKEDKCYTTDIQTCYPGYYQSDASILKCVPVPKGYYADGKGTEKLPCPAPSTSDGGDKATSIQSCYIKGGKNGTKFCDSAGCFYLPDGITIYHK